MRNRLPLAALALALAVTLATRLLVLLSPIGRLDGDEGVTGVMAQRILDGTFPVFFGEQNYQGALEQYLQAGSLALLPDTPLALRLVQVGLVLAAIVLTYLIATRVTRSPWGGVVAAWLLAVGPYFFVVKGVKSHGGYDGAMVAGLAMILLALMLRRTAHRAPWMAAGIGLAGGVALWENPTAAYLVVPAALWALGSARGALRRLVPWAAGGVVVGVLPWIIHVVRSDRLVPSGTGSQPVTTAWGRLRTLADPVLPDFLGLSNSNPAIAPGLPSRAIAMALLAILFTAIWTRRRGLLALIMLRREGRRPIDLILAGLIVTPAIYVASPFTWYIAEPRYLFTLYPLVAIAASAGVFAVKVQEFRMAAGITAVVGSAFLLGTSLSGSIQADGSLAITQAGAYYSEDLPAVADELKRQGITSVYGNFWVAGPLQFSTGNEVQVASGRGTAFPDVDAQVRRSRAPAIVVPAEPGAVTVRTTLRSSGRSFTETRVGRFVIFSRISPAWHADPERAVI